MSALSLKLKQKYPQYVNIPDEQLDAMVVQKYPQYAQLAQRKATGGELGSAFAGNVAKSGVNVVKDTIGGLVNVLNPDLDKNTIANAARTTIGTMQRFQPGEQGLEGYSRGLQDFYDQRYGVSDALKGDFESAGRKIGTSAFTDPVGVALDASTVLEGGGAALKAGGLAGLGDDVARVGRYVDPFQASAKVASKGFGKVGDVLPGLAGKVDEFGEGVATRGLGSPAQLEKVEGLAGRKAGKLMGDYGVFDRTPEAFSEASRGVGSKIDDLIMGADRNISTRDFLSKLDAEIQRLRGQADVSDTARAQMNSLIERRAGIERYLGGGTNAVPLEFSPSQAREIKRGVYQDVNPSTFNPSYQGSGRQLAAKTTYKNLISAIDEVAPGTQQLGRDQAALIKLKKLAERSQSRGASRNLVSLPKMLGGGAGAAVAGLPGAAAGMAFEAVANSPLASRTIAKGSSKIADFLRQPKSLSIPKSVKNTAGALYNTGRAGRAIASPVAKKDQSKDQQSPQSKFQSSPNIIPQLTMNDLFNKKKKKNVFGM